MVKFIATDLDGTLLLPNGNLPEDTFDLIEKLYNKGVLFAPASGRQYANLRKLFEPVKDKVLFICENGSLVKYREQTLSLSPVPNEKIATALNELRKTSWACPMLCGENCAYIENGEEPFKTLSFNAYSSCKLVDSLNDVIGKENICKIAIYDRFNLAHAREDSLKESVPLLKTVVSGKSWCDMTEYGVNKGTAIRSVRKKLGVSKEETIAFGDHMNDLEMLLESGRAYVTQNAYPPLKEIIKNEIPSNKDEGVIKYLKKLLKEL